MIKHFDFYMVRRPARSVNLLKNFHQQISVGSLENALRAHFQDDPFAREAILIASPPLAERMNQWLAGNDISEKSQLMLTLYKYLVRSSTRCTPFGLFSCSAAGEVGDQTDIRFESSHAHTTLSIDIELLTALCQELLSIPSVKEQLTLFPNSSIYNTGSRYHYVEKVTNGAQSKHFISAVEKSHALDLALQYAENGVSFKTLAQLLTKRGNSYEDTLNFVGLLLDNQILETDIRPKVTGQDSLSYIISKLSALKLPGQILQKLNFLKSSLQNPTSIAAVHKHIKKELEALGATSAGPHVLKADSFFKPDKNVLSKQVVQEIGDTLSELMVFNQEKLSEDFKDFRNKLARRYGEQEIPLTQALDDDIGLGYGKHGGIGAGYSPMIDELELSGTETRHEPKDAFWQQFVLDKYLDSIQSGDRTVELTENDLESIRKQQSAKNRPKRAGAFFTFGNLLAASPQELDEGRYTFNLLACQGPSAVNMMNRFAEGIPGLEKKLRECVTAEQQMHPEVVFAEIVHLPENHAGNIMTRPALYDYEIPFIGQSSVCPGFRIALSDLMVSVRNNEVILRSKRLNKRVIPRLSNMHNYSKGLPAYRFLADLQDQDASLSLAWDWDLLKKRPHLPRVTYKKMILSRESWLLHSSEFTGKSIESTREILVRKHVSRHFAVASGDNELIIDLDVNDSLRLLHDVLRKSESVRLLEFLGTANNCLLNQSGERFVSEFIFPFIDTNTTPYTPFSLAAQHPQQENFTPGSEWLYLKIYTDEKSNNSRLINVLNAVVTDLMKKKTIQLFFFVRYRDKDAHLRIRFKGDPNARFHLCVMDALQAALAPFVASGVVYNIQTDTYHRELDRYGSLYIEQCEQLFHLDSLDTMEFLAGRSVEENERFLYAIRKTDNLLDQAKLDMDQRKAFMETLRESFFREFNGDTALRKRLNVRYQHLKSEINKTLEMPANDQEQAMVIRSILRKHPEENELAKIISGVVHMMINRIFNARQRIYELILYHCLYKHYDACLAREKSRAKHLVPYQS